jgi:hypothetical protein
MPTITIDLSDVDLPSDLTAQRRIIDSILDNTISVARDLWVAAVTGAQLPGMTRPVNDLIYRDAVMDAGVVATSANERAIIPRKPDPYGRTDAQDRIRWTERGTPRRDIKPAMLASPSAKVTGSGTARALTLLQRKAIMVKAAKTRAAPIMPGKKYVVVPFKHGDVPGAPGDRQFRVISETSPVDSWIHPGAPPRPVLSPVAHEVARRVGQIVADVLARF